MRVASAVLPRNIYAQMVERQVPRGATVAESIDVSYIEARKHCEAKVMQIIKECLQVNQKYCDPFFNLDRKSDCITPLSASGTPHYHELDKAIAKRYIEPSLYKYCTQLILQATRWTSTR